MKNIDNTERNSLAKAKPLRRRASQLKKTKTVPTAKEKLKNAVTQSSQHQKETAALLEAARSIMIYQTFQDTAQAIFDTCKGFTGATSGYVALLSKDGAENEVLLLDSGGLPCTVDPSLPMPIRGLRGEAYRTGKTVYDNNFSKSKWMRFMPEGHVTLDNVMFSPLMIEGKAAGLLGLANKPGGFNENDAHLVSAMGDFASIALRDSWALESLTQSEERYQALFDRSPDLIYLHDFEGNFIDANEAALKLLGYTSQEIDSLNFASLLPENQVAKAFEVLQELKETDTQKDVAEFRLKCKDGNFVYVETNASVIYSEGKPYAIQGIGRDITERKQTENALQERVKELTCLYKVGLELQQDLEINDICQLVIEHLVRAMQFPDITVALIEIDNKQWASDKYSRELSHSLRTEIRVGKNIRGHLCVYYTEQRPFIIPDEQNLITSVAQSLGLWLERKQAEEALKESEEKFRSLVESTSDWIWETDCNGIYTYASPKVKELLGYEPEEVVGKTPFDFMPAEEAKRIADKFKDIIAASEPIERLENKCLHKNGHLMILETSGVPAFDSDGKLLGYRGVDRDITESKKMQDSLIITDRLAALGNMAGGFAHELNNPLTGVIGYAQLLLDRKDLPGDVRKDLTGIYEEAQRAAELIKNFMVFALKRPQPKQSIDINSLINNVLKLRQHEQKKANIRVKTNFYPELPMVTVGPVRMHQVFLNIIINAEYFMSQAHNKGTLTITTEKAGEMVKAYFADDGPGIPPENITQIFNPFFTTKEIGQGIGLGLSICHSIVTEHGGNIYVESKPGKGATFTIELPINSNE